jgi:hypothetical protein
VLDGNQEIRTVSGKRHCKAVNSLYSNVNRALANRNRDSESLDPGSLLLLPERQPPKHKTLVLYLRVLRALSKFAMNLPQLPIDTIKHVIENVLADNGSRSTIIPIMLTSKQWNVRTLSWEIARGDKRLKGKLRRHWHNRFCITHCILKTSHASPAARRQFELYSSEA